MSFDIYKEYNTRDNSNVDSNVISSVLELKT